MLTSELQTGVPLMLSKHTTTRSNPDVIYPNMEMERPSRLVNSNHRNELFQGVLHSHKNTSSPWFALLLYKISKQPGLFNSKQGGEEPKPAN